MPNNIFFLQILILDIKLFSPMRLFGSIEKLQLKITN